MRLRASAVVLIIAASIVGAAFADKTNVKLEKPAPLLVAKGKPWNALMQLTRRGRRLDGVRPVLEIESLESHHSYRGREVKPGVYRARVIFPHSGVWKYKIRVGNQTLTTGNTWVIAQ